MYNKTRVAFLQVIRLTSSCFIQDYESGMGLSDSRKVACFDEWLRVTEMIVALSSGICECYYF